MRDHIQDARQVAKGVRRIPKTPRQSGTAIVTEVFADGSVAIEGYQSAVYVLSSYAPAAGDHVVILSPDRSPIVVGRYGTLTSARTLSLMDPQFGAVGDGVADDTAAVQACIDAAPSGARVTVPEGFEFLITADVVVPNPMHIVGDGTIKSGNAGAAVRVESSFVRFNGPNFVGPGFAYLVDSIAIEAVSASILLPIVGLEVRNCSFTEYGFCAIRCRKVIDPIVEYNDFTDCAYSATFFISCDGAKFDDNNVDGILPHPTNSNSYAVSFTRSVDSDDLVLDPVCTNSSACRNTIRGVSGWHAIDFHGGEVFSICDNFIYGCFRAIALGAADTMANTRYVAPKYGKVLFNHCDSEVRDGTFAEAILVTGAASGTIGSPIDLAEDILIMGNTAIGHGTVQPTNNNVRTAAIWCRTGRGINTINNTLKECSQNSITYYYDVQGKISGNDCIDPWRITGNTACCVRVFGPNAKVTVGGLNTAIRGDRLVGEFGTTTILDVGLRIESDAERVIVGTNDFEDATTPVLQSGDKLTFSFGASSNEQPIDTASETLEAGVQRIGLRK